jgi:hypothetical protein
MFTNRLLTTVLAKRLSCYFATTKSARLSDSCSGALSGTLNCAGLLKKSLPAFFGLIKERHTISWPSIP